MLPKEKRLRNTKDFKRVYQKGSFFSVSLFSLNYLPNRSKLTRLGIVVNKKVEKKAVERNKIKRRFREASRLLYDVIPPGYDVIVTVKPKAKEATYQSIEQELKQVVGKIK